VADETAPKPDSTPPPVLGPLLAMTKSRKAIVMVAAIAAATVLVKFGAASWTEWGVFVGGLVAVYMNSVAKEDAAAKSAGAE